MIRCKYCSCDFEVEQFGYAKCPNCREWNMFPEEGTLLHTYLKKEQGDKLSVQEVKKWIEPRVEKLGETKRSNLIRNKGDWKTN
jgi:phage FluMu protein Com